MYSPSSVPCAIEDVAGRLEAVYGPRTWRREKSPVDELILTILSQHTSDTNSERAFASLVARFPSWHDVISAPTSEVCDAIRSGGLAHQKAPRIQRVLATILLDQGSFDLDHLGSRSVSDARTLLMALPGVGPKTASCVLLFSLGMPALPVDTHVLRVSRRLGLIAATTAAETAHELLERALGGNRDQVYAFHLNMITHGRSVCTARRPACERCQLADCCSYFQHAQKTL